MSLFIGVDVGGTTSTIAIGNQAGEVLKISDQFATRSTLGPAATVSDIVDQIEKVTAELGHTIDELSRITLATPGPATRDGILLRSPNLDPALWDRCPIRLHLEDDFSSRHKRVPVAYIGDGQAAAVGEFSVRTGRITSGGLDAHTLDEVGTATFDSLFMTAVGTGLGGGEVRSGVGVQGFKGRAGHAGHILLPHFAFRYDHDRELKVGNSFCTAESAISLTALTHQLGYRMGLPQWADHPLHQSDDSVRDKAKRLRDLAGEGDPLALELFDDQAKALGLALLTINYVGDYDRLVIGGGVCEMADDLKARYLKIVKETYHEFALDGFRDFDDVSFSVCGDSASVIGAVAHAVAGNDSQAS